MLSSYKRDARIPQIPVSSKSSHALSKETLPFNQGVAVYSVGRHLFHINKRYIPSITVCDPYPFLINILHSDALLSQTSTINNFPCHKIKHWNSEKQWARLKMPFNFSPLLANKWKIFFSLSAPTLCFYFGIIYASNSLKVEHSFKCCLQLWARATRKIHPEGLLDSFDSTEWPHVCSDISFQVHVKRKA